MTGTTRAALKRKKALEIEHFVPADDAQAAALAHANSRLALARFKGDDEEIEKATAKAEEVREDVRKKGTSFVFRGIGRVRFEELMREHPATDAQVKHTQATFNPDTFYAALFSETVVGGLPPEVWQEDFFDSPEWGAGEIDELRKKAMTVNTGTRVAELGN